MIHSRPRPIQILLVEDNPGDVRLTREALSSAKVSNALNVVNDGEAAMDYLCQRGEYVDAVRPDLILLDLNLPKKNGREVLAEVKSDPELKRIPVVVLTISKADEDILHSYNLQANCYINKPVDLAGFLKVVQSVEEFWLTVVALPPDR